MGLNENPNTLITNIGTGKQQLVEIAKALNKKVKLLILDEPTSSLNERDSEALLELLRLEGLIQLCIPRGGEALKDFLLEKSRIPVLAAAGGICHVYLDRDASADMAVSITLNAKVQRPGVCNAAETLLVHADRTDLLQPVLSALRDAGVELRGDERTRAAIDFEISAATDADWDAEYLDLILAARVVDDLEAALDHIDRHSTGHSEAIVTEDLRSAERFLAEADFEAQQHHVAA